MKEGKEHLSCIVGERGIGLAEGPCVGVSQLAFSLRSRRRHPHAIASITICGDPDGLGFLRVAPVSLSVTNRLVDRRQFGSLVRSLARPLPVVVHSLVQSPARSRARSLPPFSSLFRIPINNTHFVSSL